MKEPKFLAQADEIKHLVRGFNGTAQELAERAGVKWTTFRRLAGGYQKAGEHTMRSIRQAASSPVLSPFKEASAAYMPNMKSRLRYIPVVSWAKAGAAIAYEDLTDEWMRRVPADSTDPRAFGVDIVGDSMEPNFREGETAILLPSQQPQNGDLVVANLKERGPVFKLFHMLGGDRFKLTSYNPVYPAFEITEADVHWIYAVDSVIRNVRRRR